MYRSALEDSEQNRKALRVENVCLKVEIASYQDEINTLRRNKRRLLEIIKKGIAHEQPYTISIRESKA